MEHLNIHNYEAFYLDFLEGNLNVKDTALLFRFLDENPSLKLEVENFETFEKEIEELDNSFKNDLKQVDFELDEVSQLTINSFLIAQIEKQLPAKKEKEIEDYLLRHPKFKVDQQQIKSTILVPDLSITYPDKKRLKKSETRYLWPTISSVAAVIVILILALNPTSTSLDGVKKVAVLSKKSTIKNDTIIVTKELISLSKNEKLVNVKRKKRYPFEVNPEIIVAEVVQVDTLPVKAEVISNEVFASNGDVKNSDYIPTNSSEILVSKSLLTTKETSDCVSILDKYPIESFTNNLSKILKKQVEFKTCKNTKSNKTGFYLKIGKFIISKQTT